MSSSRDGQLDVKEPFLSREPHSVNLPVDRSQIESVVPSKPELPSGELGGEVVTEDVIFQHVPDGTSSDEGWVKRAYRVYLLLLRFKHANVVDSMTVYITNIST